MTAEWWSIQEDIKAGTAGPATLTHSVLTTINRILQTEYPKLNESIIPKEEMRGKGIQPDTLGICPRCGKPIIEGKKGYGCSGWKEGCKFTIWKHPKLSFMAKSSITKNDAKKLLAGKKVLKKNLVSKAGKKFEAYIYLEDDPQSPYGPSIKLEFTKGKKEKSGKTERPTNKSQAINP